VIVIDQSSGQPVPIPGAAVTLTNAAGGPPQTGMTDGNGTVTLARQAPSPDTATASVSDGSYGTGSAVVLRSDNSATITLTPNKPHLFVSVNNPQSLPSLPQVGAAVTITPSDGSAAITGTTLPSMFNGSANNPGTFTSGLFGPVTVTAGVTYAVSVVGSDGASTARGSVTIPQSGTASQVLALDLLPSAVLTVTVSDPSKNPLAGAAVSVNLASDQLGAPPFASGKTDGSGTVTFLLPTGQTYIVTASLTGFNIASQQTQFTAAQTLAFTLQPSAPPPNLIVTVVNANRAPVANATVGIFLFDPTGRQEPLLYTGTTGATGVAAFVVDTTRQYQAGAAIGAPPTAPDTNSPVISFPPTPQQVTLILPNAPASWKRKSSSPATAPTSPAAGAQGTPSRGKVLPAPGR
jgi:hypothetical protein